MRDESTLTQVEEQFAGGITSAQLLDVFQGQLSEATLRKYVQLGLLPRSVRVGCKGKRRGSLGVYPVSVVRLISRIKTMLAQDWTIEQIQRDFLFMRSDLQQLEQSLANIFNTLDEVVSERRRREYALDVAAEVSKASRVGDDLVARLRAIETRLTTRAHLSRVATG
jgi:DNA-binding transcriptional MerR regulator